uniref:ATP-dependent DNA helicase n=1 Tax=Mycena chlorophos TaxID=658473 RepID=A0ABQ0KX70_MYCCL|nr:ATP-dependent DNA helicase [Mycena chlorophos]
MLLLLTPWRDLRELPNGQLSFQAAFTAFLAEASAEQKQVIENIKYFYECSDRASQRREEEGEVDGRRAAGEDMALTTVQPLNTVALAGLQEPTEADIERAREERHAARERVYGQGTVDIALEHGIFQDSYAAAPPKPIAKQATLEDTVKYEEWGRKIAGFVREVIHTEDSEENGMEIDDGAVVAGAAVGSSHDEPDPGGVVDLRNNLPTATAFVAELNAEQSRAHGIVLDHLQETLAGRSPPQLLMIICGAGGTGKTVLLNAIAQSFEAFGATALLAKTATTGVAASLFGGQTLHNWAGIGIGENAMRPSRATREKRERNMTQTRYLVIDEYSMLTKKLLEQLSNILGSVKEPLQECDSSDCFGGISVVLVGDLHQFPPVGNIRQSLFHNGDEAEKYSPIGLDLYCRFTTVVTLTEQRRYGSCLDGLLGTIARGRVHRRRHGDAGGITRWRDKRYGRLEQRTMDERRPGHSQAYGTPQDVISRSGEALSPWERFAVAQHKTQQTGKLSDFVQIAVGMRAMILMNISTNAELANGSRGVVHDVVLNWQEKLPLQANPVTGEIMLEYPPAVVLFKLDSGTLPAFEGLDAGILPITPSRMKFSAARMDKSRFTVAQTQVAMTPGYAFTDYKSQGQTLEHVIVDLGAMPSGALTPFNAYVALSRSHGCDNIRILRGFDKRLFTVHPSVFLRREDQRLAHCTSETIRATERNE